MGYFNNLFSDVAGTGNKFIFRLKASMEEVQKRFLAEQKTLKELNDKARQIEEALA